MLGDEKVVEKLSKNDEKNISLVFWLEEHHCKCSDKYYICMSKGQLPVEKRISQTRSKFGHFAVATIQIKWFYNEG